MRGVFKPRAIMRCLRSSAGDRAPPGATLNTKAAGPQPVPTDGRCLVRGQGATLRRMRGHLLGHFKEGKAGFSPSPPLRPPALFGSPGTAPYGTGSISAPGRARRCASSTACPGARGSTAAAARVRSARPTRRTSRPRTCATSTAASARRRRGMSAPQGSYPGAARSATCTATAR